MKRIIDSEKTFNTLVQWFHDEIIIQRRAPGLLIGLSGTDSLVTFLAAYKAFEKVGKTNRIMGVHFAPSEDFLYDYPEAEVHSWFGNQIIPWLKKQAPESNIVIDTSIDWRCDGLRWGYLMDLSVVTNDNMRMMRLPENQYWVLGTRNRTEDILMNYSNASSAVSIQPIIHLWKSEILQISEYIGIPQIAITKSCETDCICGRRALAANHISEVDMLLIERCGEGAIDNQISSTLYQQLTKYIDAQISKAQFKKCVPYTPDPYVFAFESEFLDIKKFNHFGHLYIAFHYLKRYSFDVAFERYLKYLKPILDLSGQSHRFNPELTKKYFTYLDKIMKEYPAYDDFGELTEAIPTVLLKISA